MSENTLTRSAQIVQNTLKTKGYDCQVIKLPTSTHTASEAATSIGCTVSQIIKSLIFRTKDTQDPILVLASGANRVNEKSISKHIGEKIERADADFVRRVTGFAIGGIPPVGHQQFIRTLIDEDLLSLGTLWAAAGTPNAVFSIEASHIKSITGGEIIAIK